MNATLKADMNSIEKRYVTFFSITFILGFAVLALNILVPDIGNFESIFDIEDHVPAITGVLMSLGSLFVAFKFWNHAWRIACARRMR